MPSCWQSGLNLSGFDGQGQLVEGPSPALAVLISGLLRWEELVSQDNFSIVALFPKLHRHRDSCVSAIAAIGGADSSDGCMVSEFRGASHTQVKTNFSGRRTSR